MTREELIAALRHCTTGDCEADHANADELLLKYINDPEVTAAFNDIDKWYA